MTDDKQPDLERVPTGIAGLDTILRGGFLNGGVYIVQGTPGAGKTVLANQVAFRHVAAGGQAIFITLLSESHARMLQHLRSMSFYDEAAVPSSLYYVSGFNILETDGLKGIVDLLRREIKGHKASLLVLDGFGITEESASSEREFKKFVQEIQSHAAASECTALLLTNGSNRAVTPEYTMVDGLIELDDSLHGERSERSLRVHKFRGSGFLAGRHAFRITDDGIVVYPRIEAVFAEPSARNEYRLRRLSSGIEGLDAMLGGGLPAESTNGLFGPTGSGKTTFGLQFIGLSTAAEPGLFFGAFETPERLRVKAAQFGIDFAAMEERGEVEFIWRPQGERIVDDLGHEIVDAVRRRGVKRLFVDGLGALMESAIHRERMGRYISALANELRALGVTMIITMEDRQILGASMRLPIDGMSSLLEGLILLRYAEVEGQVRRFVSITKIRDSDFDPFLHEMKIAARGLEVGGTMSGAEAILSGYAREPQAVASVKPQRNRPEE